MNEKPCGVQYGHSAHNHHQTLDGTEYRCHGAFDADSFRSAPVKYNSIPIGRLLRFVETRMGLVAEIATYRNPFNKEFK